MSLEHEPLEETLRRLADERADADRRYNDALTALDSAVLNVPDLPELPPAYDERQIGPLNSGWDIGVASHLSADGAAKLRALLTPFGVPPPL